MPIKRFARALERDGRLEAYLALLVNHFNPATASGLMCRDTISVGFDGALYDCDFNQMLELPVVAGAPGDIRDFDAAALEGREIVTGPHCFGCTAGAGSSCTGAVVPER